MKTRIESFATVSSNSLGGYEGQRDGEPSTKGTIKRHVSLEGELPNRKQRTGYSGATAHWRPARLIETVHLDNGEITYYSVKIAGPKVNKDGADHKTQSLDEEWTHGRRWNFSQDGPLPQSADYWSEVRNLPFEVRELTVGAVRLASWPWEG